MAQYEKAHEYYNKSLQIKLQKYPEIETETNHDFILVKPKSKNGFPVSLNINGYNSFTVAFGNWHEEFDSEDEALNCFAFGLSNECRLKIAQRGSNIYKWTVEYLKDNKWIEDSTTGFFNFQFWVRSEIKYLQNNIIKK